MSENQLTLEQQFRLLSLKEEVLKLNLEDSQNYLLELLKQGMLKDNLLKKWIKQ